MIWSPGCNELVRPSVRGGEARLGAWERVLSLRCNVNTPFFLSLISIAECYNHSYHDACVPCNDIN